MKHLLWALAIAAAAVGPAAAHHSYAAYDRERLMEIDGIIEDFEVRAPHTLLKVRSDDGRLVTAEWGAPTVLERFGIGPKTLAPGERVVITGNPHREFDRNGVVNLKSIRRLSDGWKWPGHRPAQL
jgi:hypothetical protein